MKTYKEYIEEKMKNRVNDLDKILVCVNLSDCKKVEIDDHDSHFEDEIINITPIE